METKLFVGNLAYSATEDDLRKLFTQAGEVQSVNVIKTATRAGPKDSLLWK
jgi:RNA recognition motif-containing protein